MRDLLRAHSFRTPRNDCTAVSHPQLVCCLKAPGQVTFWKIVARMTRFAFPLPLIRSVYTSTRPYRRLVEGYLLQTVSAGLLTSIGSAPYAVTKHAALARAEYGDHARRRGHQSLRHLPARCAHEHAHERSGEFLDRGIGFGGGGVEEAAIRGIEEERFLMLPHPEVAEYFRRKGDDYHRWLRGMRRLQRQVRGGRSGSDSGAPGANRS